MGRNKELLLYITPHFSYFPVVEGLSLTAVSFLRGSMGHF
jgi:hypothetical protein